MTPTPVPTPGPMISALIGTDGYDGLETGLTTVLTASLGLIFTVFAVRKGIGWVKGMV